MHYSTRSFIGHPSPTSWSQYWENEPDDYNLKTTHGHLFGLISLDSTSNVPNELGREIIQYIDEQYFSLVEPNPVKRLSSVLQSIKEKYLNSLNRFDLVIALIVGDKLHLFSFNSGLVFLQRDSQISRLLHASSQDISTISGRILPNDRLVLSTQGFFDQYGWDQIKLFLSPPTIEEVEENFVSLLHSLESPDTVSGVVIAAHSEDPVSVLSPESPSLSPTITPNHPRIHQNFLNRFFPKKTIQVSPSTSLVANRRHKLNILVAFILIIAFSVSIYFGASRNQSIQLEKEYQSLKSQYESKYSSALAIKSLNLAESQSIAKEASVFVEQMSSLGLYSQEVTSFRSQVQQLLSQTGSSEAYQPDFLYDTGNIGTNSSYNLSFLHKNQLYLFDSKKGQVDMVDISTRSQKQIVNNSDLIGATSFAVNDSGIFFLKEQKILLVKDNVVSIAIDLSTKIDGLVSGQINFWNGSLYLLAITSGNPTIWKFAPSASGFSSGNVWLKAGQSLPADSVSFTINSNIWVLSKSGKIISYTLGQENDLSSFTSSSATTEASNLVVSLDGGTVSFSEKSMVYVGQKDTSALSGYNFGERLILSLGYDPSSKNILVLCSDQKIYKISL